MHPSATRKPDGSFHCDDRDYRLHQVDDHFDVVRVDDGTKIGGFAWSGKSATLDEDTSEPKVVRAIAALLSSPRGLLPLQ